MIVGTSVSLMNLALWGQTEPVLFVLKFLSDWSYCDGISTFGELLNTGASRCCLIKSNLTDSALYTMWCTKPVGITQLFASLLLVTLVKQYEVLPQYEPHCVYCCCFIGEVIGFGFWLLYSYFMTGFNLLSNCQLYFQSQIWHSWQC